MKQQGRVIYETTVAAGPFQIRDLSNALSGKLDVEVAEQDGSVQTFQVDAASVPYLTRPDWCVTKWRSVNPRNMTTVSKDRSLSAVSFHGVSVTAGLFTAAGYLPVNIMLSRRVSAVTC